MPEREDGSAALAGLDDRAVDRRRVGRLFLIAVALANVAMVAATTVTALVAESLRGGATWAGIPLAASVIGIAVGTAIVPRCAQRFRLRPTLIGAYGIATLGAGLALTATLLELFPLQVVGMAVLGSGQSASVLTRYFAADLEPPERRASALSMVVWMGTVGAIVGPNLLAPAGGLFETAGLPPLGGAYAVAVVGFGLAAAVYVLLLRPDPSELLWLDVEESSAAGPALPVGALQRLREPKVMTALVVMVVGHVVMVLIMTMTPLHVRHSGHGLASVGLIASGHTVGMFAFSPWVGRVVEGFGQLVAISAGLLLLVLSAISAVLAGGSVAGLFAALFLLGLGWNFGFVGGSSLLTRDIPQRERSRLQGLADSAVWTSAAVASVSASLLLDTVGYAGLCWIGGSLVVLPIVVLLVHGRALPPRAAVAS